MNTEEFRVWLDYHGAAFPGVVQWMLTKGKGVRPHWEKALANATLEHAKRATDGLLAGEFTHPQGYSNLPGAIASICNRMANAERPTYGDNRDDRCPECDNYGTIQVWHPEQVKAMKEGRFDRTRGSLTAMTACTCSRGDRMATRTQSWKPLPRYSELHYLRVNGNYRTDGEITELEEFAFDATRHSNYHDEFSAYS